MTLNIGTFLDKNLSNAGNWQEAGNILFSDIFNFSAGQIEKVLAAALEKGADYADIYFEYSVYNSIVLDEKIVKSASQNVSMGAGIRALKGDQTGFAHSEALDLESLMKAARIAASISQESSAKNVSSLGSGLTFPNRYPVINPAKNLSMPGRVEILQQADEAARIADKRVAQVSANINDSISFILFANSEGILLSDTRPLLRVGVNTILKDKERFETASSGGGGRVGLEYFDREPIQKHALEAVRQASILMEAKNAPAGHFPVILKAAQSGILLHEAIGHPLEADFNRKNTSAYSNRMGELVASPLCTIIDDGTILNDRGSINFDDEGIISQKNILIENGKLVKYMHDRISAKYYKTEPTGNGRRESFEYFPIPRMTTTYMENGESDPQEIIASVDKGIYCCTFKGGQVDISNGDFVFVPVEAYWIEKGKISHPVKNFTLIGNGPDVLTKVSMVGNDFAFSDGMWTCGKGQSVPVGIGLPTLKIDDMTVGGQ